MAFFSVAMSHFMIWIFFLYKISLQDIFVRKDRFNLIFFLCCTLEFKRATKKNQGRNAFALRPFTFFINRS